MKKAFVIFSGYNQRGIIAFLRVLKTNNIDSFIVASGSLDSIFKTAYANKVIFTRENLELDKKYIDKAIVHIKSNASKYELYLAPSTEAINRFFLAHRDHYEKLGLNIPLVEKNLYQLVSDKRSFGELCRENNILIPNDIINPHTHSLPFVAKPAQYSSIKGLSPILVFNENDRRALLDSPDLSEYFFQEFIHGRSLYLLLHVSRKGEVHSFSQENLIQQPHGKSILAAVASEFHLSRESENYITMLKSIGFHGLIMIEIRENNGYHYMIEANPRFWGPSQLFVDAMHENLFEAFLIENEFPVTVKVRKPKYKRYFWYQGFIDTITSGEKPIFHNYSAPEMAIEFPKWLVADIYRRPDTIKIFINDLMGGL